jgi:hypothetical protein
MKSDVVSLPMMMLIGLVALVVAARLRNVFGDGE